MNPVVAISDAHQHQQLEEQHMQPGASTIPLLDGHARDDDSASGMNASADSQWRAGHGSYRGSAAAPPVAAAYPYASGSSATYDPSPGNRFFRSKPARNTALIVFVLILLSSLLHATQPELVDHGYRVLSNAVYRNMGWKERQEMLSLDARLKELLDRPALDQWEFETLCRHGCPFYTYSRNSKP